MVKDGAYRMVGSHLDITARRRSEQMLLERDSQLIAAQRIQEYMLPQDAPKISGFDIAGSLIAAEFAAGDYFDYLRMRDGSLLIVVGDVAGHGFSSALGMAITSAHLRSFVEHHSDVEEILNHTNAILCKETEESRFVTLFLLQLEPAMRTFSYLNAGHPTAFLLNASGDVRLTLHSTSLPLAVTPDAEFPVNPPENLEPGDLILMVTDGIQEARDPDGTLFGTDRMLEIVRANLARPAREIITTLQQVVCDFTGRRQPEDDITCVIVRLPPDNGTVSGPPIAAASPPVV